MERRKDELAYSANHSYREGYEAGLVDAVAMLEDDLNSIFATIDEICGCLDDSLDSLKDILSKRGEKDG